ncbi:MAG: flagellar motor protein MotB [Syntrophales bacterium]
MEGSQARPIIVKKKKKKHAEHHGGSWKVAYADFVTAMMAFFLLMWLLAMASPEKRAAVSLYFKNFDVFNIGKSFSGKSFMSGTDQAFREDSLSKASRKVKASTQAQVQSLSSEDLSKRLKLAVNEQLSSVRNQVLVDITGEGVRIQIVDAEESPMFALGSASPTPRAQEILKLVAENIIDIPNRVVIEGHTDGAPFRSARITNWELSTDRASSARRLLEANGIEPERIARVVGYADQELYIKLDPTDPRNRRISIILQRPAGGLE